LQRKNDRAALDRRNRKAHKKETYFSRQKHKYGDKIVDYNNSPSGKAYVGLSKLPLMPNDNGIGFKGVLLQSENRDLVQCSECGRWFKCLSSTHLATHGLTRQLYREKYGLNKRESLISDTLSRYYSDKITHQPIMVENYTSGKYIEKAHKAWRKVSRESINLTPQKANLMGTCPLQMEQGLIEYINRFHRIPHSTGGKRGFRVNLYKDRFGSMNNALAHYGLPTRHRTGNKTQYIFPDKQYYFVDNTGRGYETLYQVMLKKCPILTN